MTCLEPIIFIGTNANNANNRFEIMAGSPMAHLATLRDDCGLVNYTIPVKHYTIRHCQLQNNRQIAPHRILLNTIQRCSKVSKLSIAEQKSSQNVLENHEWSFSLNEGKGGFGWLLRMGVEAIFNATEIEMLGQLPKEGLHLLLTFYIQNGAELETMLVESGLGGEY